MGKEGSMKKSVSSPFLNVLTEEHFFEGAEKRLEMDFNFVNEDAPQEELGFRSLTRAKWDDLLSKVNCMIMSVTSNDYMDMYVLSESSLFVYPRKVMIKTCGTTTLLNCVPLLLEYAESIGLSVDYVTYSHKNFQRPSRQMHPYAGRFTHEISTLNRWFNGNGYVLGPMNGDRWFIYVADVTKQQSSADEIEQTVEILMSDLSPKAMQMFYKGSLSSAEVTELAGIDQLIPGSVIDDLMFEPCGYSMNSQKGEYYSTIHVTPEPSFSYVSFEANIPVDSYDKLVKEVLDIFQPGKVIVSVFADRSAICGHSSEAISKHISGYNLTCKTTCEFDGRRGVTCSHFRSAFGESR